MARALKQTFREAIILVNAPAAGPTEATEAGAKMPGCRISVGGIFISCHETTGEADRAQAAGRPATRNNPDVPGSPGSIFIP